MPSWAWLLPYSCSCDPSERKLPSGEGTSRGVRLQQRAFTLTSRHREMQFFLIGYFIISLCEIFTIGGFPLSGAVRRGFVAVHIASIIATTWILMMNGAVGYQLIDDGTALSVGLIFGSAAALFIGTGYIALDTGFSFTDYWAKDNILRDPNQAYALYTLYQIVPLLFLVVFFILETVLVLRVLGETRPMSKSSRIYTRRTGANV